MYFQKGKRKGNSSFQVVDAGSTRSRFCVPAPVFSEIRDDCSSTDEGEANDNAGMNIFADDTSECDSDVELRDQRTYKRRREKLGSNWDKIRLQLLKKSAEVDGFLPEKCCSLDCSQPAKTRCRDCGYSAYYCTECCDIMHRENLQFHVCEILEVSKLSVLV